MEHMNHPNRSKRDAATRQEYTPGFPHDEGLPTWAEIDRLRAINVDLLAALKIALEASTQGRDDKSWEDGALAAIAKSEGR